MPACKKWVAYTPEECAEQALAYMTKLEQGCLASHSHSTLTDDNREAINACVDRIIERTNPTLVTQRKSQKYFCGAYVKSRWE